MHMLRTRSSTEVCKKYGNMENMENIGNIGKEETAW